MNFSRRKTARGSVADRADASAVAVPFAAIVLAMLPAVLDQTILATALPVIARDLGSLSDVSWVVTAYVVAAAATTPLWGKLCDRHGHESSCSRSRWWPSSPPPRSAAPRRTSAS
jgi:MFS family permease